MAGPQSVDDSRFAVAEDAARRITGLTQRQLRYWAATDLIVPSVSRRMSVGKEVRLYTFGDLMALMVAAGLKKRHISLQHIRKLVGHLRDRGYDHPLTELNFATVNREVYVQHSDGEWEGDLSPDQIVIHQVIDLAPLRMRIARAAQRDATSSGQIERRRGTRGSKPVIAGTRLPVDTVRRALDAGRTPEEIRTSYPFLTEDDVAAVQRAIANA